MLIVARNNRKLLVVGAGSPFVLKLVCGGYKHGAQPGSTCGSTFQLVRQGVSRHACPQCTSTFVLHSYLLSVCRAAHTAGPIVVDRRLNWCHHVGTSPGVCPGPAGQCSFSMTAVIYRLYTPAILSLTTKCLTKYFLVFYSFVTLL